MQLMLASFFRLLLNSLLIFPLLMAMPRFSIAEERIQLQEDLELDFGSAKEPTHVTSRKSTIKKLESYLEKAETQTGVIPPEFTRNEIQYLTGAYLVCSLKRGTCKEILEGLLHLDLVHLSSDRAKATPCPRLNDFWRFWLKNEMEKRHEYHIRTAFIKQREKFNQLVRPRYLRCSKTVKTMLRELSHQETHTKTTAPDGPVATMVKLLKEISKVVSNVNDPKYYN